MSRFNQAVEEFLKTYMSNVEILRFMRESTTHQGFDPIGFKPLKQLYNIDSLIGVIPLLKIRLLDEEITAIKVKIYSQDLTQEKTFIDYGLSKFIPSYDEEGSCKIFNISYKKYCEIIKYVFPHYLEIINAI